MTVEELLASKKIALKPSGNDYLVSCLNPEHDDSSPSMRIDKVLGIFNCLSCGFSGNIFEHYGEQINKLDTTREQIRRKLTKIRQESIGIQLPEALEPVSADYRVGLPVLTRHEAFRTQECDMANRIVFPVRDLKGKINCLVGRSEDAYNSKKYLVYPAGASTPLYPLHLVKPLRGRVMIVEGLFDILNLSDAGYQHVLCAFGTRKINEEKLTLLKVLGVTSLDLFFDSDEAGQSAATEVKEMAEGLGFHVRNIRIKSGDPGDMSKASARNLYEKLYKERIVDG